MEPSADESATGAESTKPVETPVALAIANNSDVAATLGNSAPSTDTTNPKPG